MCMISSTNECHGGSSLNTKVTQHGATGSKSWSSLLLADVNCMPFDVPLMSNVWRWFFRRERRTYSF